jgi:hypothetical protein
MFDDEKAILRIDMSEYMEKHSVSKLIGAPPGYVGYEQGGILTDAVRRRPYQVILFDEVEKAHVDTFNILLQVLDEGKLTDSQGRHVNFTNTIIILTSNIGATHISKLPENTNINTATYNLVMNEVKNIFKPEFINRLDEIILFERLNKKFIVNIVGIQLANLQKRLEENRYKVEFEDEVYTYLAYKGYDIIYGARPLKRVIQREIENFLANEIIAGKLPIDKSVFIRVEGEGNDMKIVIDYGKDIDIKTNNDTLKKNEAIKEKDIINIPKEQTNNQQTEILEENDNNLDTKETITDIDNNNDIVDNGDDGSNEYRNYDDIVDDEVNEETDERVDEETDDEDIEEVDNFDNNNKKDDDEDDFLFNKDDFVEINRVNKNNNGDNNK